MNFSFSQHRLPTYYGTAPSSPHSIPHQRSNNDLHAHTRVPSREIESHGLQYDMSFKNKTPSNKIIIGRTQSVKNINHKRRCSNVSQNSYPNKFFNTQKVINYHNMDIKNEMLCQTSSTMKQIQNVDHNRCKFFHSRNKTREMPKTSLFTTKKLNGSWFDAIKPIGKGKYGKVYLVKDKETGFLMALKAIEKKKLVQANLLEQFIRQLKIQFYLDHPGIIKLYGFFDDPLNFYLLMELGCDGQLYDKISDRKLLSQQSSSFITRSLLDVVDYMHSEKVLHRDIKPENIVVVLGNPKICDFGWAVYNNTEMRSTFCGTPLYFSPQLLSGQEYDEKVDLWAIGVLTFELVFGISPFNLRQPQDLSRIITHEVQFPKNAQVSSQFKQFIKKILQKDPNKRPTPKQLLRTKFIQHYLDLQVCQQLCNSHTQNKIEQFWDMKYKDGPKLNKQWSIIRK